MKQPAKDAACTVRRFADQEEINMQSIKIKLDTIDKVKNFVNTISKYDFDFDLVSGRYVIDAKSIMGIFSLDLSNPIDLNIHADGKELEEVIDVLQPYAVPQEK